jgi:1-deoxyxylulose-5-phosphate synthase
VARIAAPQDLWYAARALLRHRSDVAEGARFGFLNRLPGITGPQAALAHVLQNPDVACAVIGTTRTAHLIENLASSGMSLPEDAAAAIRARHLERLSG